jgi:hypothetical protein
MQKSETIVELAKSLSKFQGDMKSVPKDSTNPFFKMKYASIDAIWDIVRKPLSSNGLSLIQTTYEQNDKIYLETTLLHSSGEWIETYMPINATKQDPQTIGSAITYARRYSMSAILGVSADSDDDAESATSHKETQTATKPIKQSNPLPASVSATVTPKALVQRTQCHLFYERKYESLCTPNCGYQGMVSRTQRI